MVKQILAIDLGTDLLPALALSTERPEPDTMQHPPRRRNQPLIDRNLLVRSFLWLGLIEAALCYSVFFFVLKIAGIEQIQNLPLLSEIITRYFAIPSHHAGVYAVTLFHAGVVTSQVGNAFACRTEVNRGRKLGWLSNRFLLVGVLIEIVMIISLIYIPSLAHLFDHLPLPLGYWLGLAMFAPLLYSLDWIRKYLLRRSQH